MSTRLKTPFATAWVALISLQSIGLGKEIGLITLCGVVTIGPIGLIIRYLMQGKSIVLEQARVDRFSERQAVEIWLDALSLGETSGSDYSSDSSDRD